jgi:RNA polymerase sigma-70 factor (ECF subfamily)
MNEPARDEALMAEVARGRYDTLETLIRRHATPLLSFIHRMTGDYHHSEELFQEVFFAVWCKRRIYEYPRPFKTWLYAIAVNHCRSDFRRAPPPTEPLAGKDLPEPFLQRNSPVTTVLAAERAAIIAAAVARLPEPQRVVVVLRVWQQMSYVELAQVLNQPDGTIRSHMHRGLCALRELLEGRLGQDDCNEEED